MRPRRGPAAALVQNPPHSGPLGCAQKLHHPTLPGEAPLSIHVALNHITHYRYDRRVALSPQVVRLRPAPHSRTRILSYSMKVTPTKHFINWQQDPQSNYLARLVFPDKTEELRIEVDLVAEMAVLNPFDAQFLGFVGEDEAGQVVGLGVLLPVDEVLRRGDLHRIGQDSRARMRRRPQADHLGAQGHATVVAVVRNVIERDVNGQGASPARGGWCNFWAQYKGRVGLFCTKGRRWYGAGAPEGSEEAPNRRAAESAQRGAAGCAAPGRAGRARRRRSCVLGRAATALLGRAAARGLRASSATPITPTTRNPHVPQRAPERNATFPLDLLVSLH